MKKVQEKNLSHSALNLLSDDTTMTLMLKALQQDAMRQMGVGSSHFEGKRHSSVPKNLGIFDLGRQQKLSRNSKIGL